MAEKPGRPARPPGVDQDGFPRGLTGVLADSTRRSWLQIAPYLPPGSYLAGGTAVAIHLRHRLSRDLDFFTAEPLDTDELIENLERSGLPFLLERSVRDRNVEITLGSTRIEFSAAVTSKLVEPTTTIAGVQVAGLGDLLAMKLSAITKRRQLRDFVDIEAIERQGGRRIEEGLALAAIRYGLGTEDGLLPMVGALGGSGDCPEDPLVAVPQDRIASYFAVRLPEVIASLGRWSSVPVPDDVAAEVARLLREDGRSTSEGRPTGERDG